MSYRLEEAEYRHGNESREQAELIGQLRQEVVEVTEAFRGQLHGLQEDQQRVVQSLQQELDLAKNTLTKLQQVTLYVSLLLCLAGGWVHEFMCS